MPLEVYGQGEKKAIRSIHPKAMVLNSCCTVEY